MESSEETYVAICKCGQIYSVLGYEAGDERMCGACSQSFRIPFILKTPAQQIESMIQYNQLPSNRTCPFTGEDANIRVDIGIYEGAKPIDIPGWFLVLIFLTFVSWLVGFIFLYSGTARDEDDEDEEVDVIVVPIRIADDPEAYISLANRETLIAALRSVPIYTHLLENYAYAETIVVNNQGMQRS